MTFLDDLKEETSVGLTQNGAKTYTSSLNANVDFFAQAGAMRQNPIRVKVLFARAYDENKEIALRNLVHLRNIRMGGLGERTAYRSAIQYVVDSNDQKAMEMLMRYTGDIGRWDDLVAIMEYAMDKGTHEWVNKVGIELISAQLKQDILAMRENGSVSLLAKWLPNINAKKESKRKMGYAIARSLGFKGSWGLRNYRKTLATLRDHLNLVEVRLASRDYHKIDFEKLPSRALFQYREAFKRNMPERYEAFMQRVEKGEVTLNAKLMMPNDIVRAYNKESRYSRTFDRVLETTWSNMENVFGDTQENAIVVADTSASMTWSDGKGATPWEVAQGLAIYTAERLNGAFHGHFITFSRNPKLIQLPMTGTLLDKMKEYERLSIVENTNLQRVFDLILKTAVKNNTPASELPSKIIVVSDMELDRCEDGKTNFENIERKFAEAGYEVPAIVFWNVNAMYANVPVRFNEKGVALVSGYSTNILKQVMGAEITTPEQMMLDTLNKPEYDFVTEGL